LQQQQLTYGKSFGTWVKYRIDIWSQNMFCWNSMSQHEYVLLGNTKKKRLLWRS
jgi:hypothetical protein